VALTGSGLESSAIVDPANVGNPGGTSSQIRPHAVSVCVTAAGLLAGALAAPEATGLGAVVGAPEGEDLAL
jgi:hypothetical protein